MKTPKWKKQVIRKINRQLNDGMMGTIREYMEAVWVPYTSYSHCDW